MIIVMDVNSPEENVNAVVDKLESNGFQAHLIRGVKRIVIGAVGDRGSLSGRPEAGIPWSKLETRKLAAGR